MAQKPLIFLVIISLIGSSTQDVNNNKVDTQEESPLADIAKEILKEKNLENIGGVVNSFIQSGGAKQIMDGVLQNLGKENSGQILDSLGSLLNDAGSTKDKKRATSKLGNKAKDEVNPMELLSGLGSIVGAMQGADGGQGNPAAVLQGLGSLFSGENNGAALLQGLGSLLGSASQEKSGKQGGNDNNAGAILQGLGSLLGAATATGNQDAGGNLLQGLGSLLGGQGNQEMIGNVISTFANSLTEDKKATKPSKTKPPKKASSVKKPKKDLESTSDINIRNKGASGLLSLASSFLGSKKGEGGFDVNFIFENFPLIVKIARSFGGSKMKKYFDPLDDLIYLYNEIIDKERKLKLEEVWPRIVRVHKAYKEFISPIIKSGRQDESFDFSSMINIASTFLSQDNKEGRSSFMDYLPMIVDTIQAFTGEQAQATAKSHSGHSWSLPPFLEKIHIYFDSFMHSEMGNRMLDYLGSQKAFKAFLDEKGEFSYPKFQELIENHSFRKHWIQQLTTKLADFLKFVSDENVQKQYIDMGIVFTNSFLSNSGFPKKALLDLKQPVSSISSFVNFAAKNYLDADVDSKEYVEPFVGYVEDLLKMSKESINLQSNPRKLTDKLADTINMDIIEPIIRVNRAYRFVKTQPTCERYIYCILNQKTPLSDPGSLPRLRKLLYKGSSLISGWFITTHTGSSYWDVYNAVAEKGNCQKYFKEECNTFYEQEIKVTTEYVHSEL